MRSVRDEEFRAFVIDSRAAMVRSATLLAAGDGHLAEDVVQSTLTRLYLAWPLFAKARNRDAYARRALINALMDEHRRPWRRRERSSSALTDFPLTETGTGTAQTEAVHAALRELPPRMRAAVVCRYFHDLSVAETADALSCSPGTVKSQTARALDRLRHVLGQPPAHAATSSLTHPVAVPAAHLDRSL